MAGTETATAARARGTAAQTPASLAGANERPRNPKYWHTALACSAPRAACCHQCRGVSAGAGVGQGVGFVPCVAAFFPCSVLVHAACDARGCTRSRQVNYKAVIRGYDDMSEGQRMRARMNYDIRRTAAFDHAMNVNSDEEDGWVVLCCDVTRSSPLGALARTVNGRRSALVRGGVLCDTRELLAQQRPQPRARARTHATTCRRRCSLRQRVVWLTGVSALTLLFLCNSPLVVRLCREKRWERIKLGTAVRVLLPHRVEQWAACSVSGWGSVAAVRSCLAF